MRNVTVDIVKGVGILSVVLCHNWILFHDRGELSRVVFSVHMPLFIFLSGLFFRPAQPLGQLILSKSVTLLKPFYVVLILNFLFYAYANSQDQNRLEFLNILYGSGGTVSWTPLWFLSHIFVVFVLAWLLNYYLLNKLSHLRYKWILLFLIYSIGVSTIGLFADNQLTDGIFHSHSQLVRGLPFNLDIALISVPIFLAGHLLSDACLKFKPNWLLVALMLVTFTGLHYFFNETIELNGRYFGNFFICTLQMVSGTYLVFSIGYFIQFIPILSKVLQYLGGATLCLLIFHFIPQHIVTGSLQYHFPQYLMICALVGMLTSILLSLVLWEIILRTPLLSRLMLPKATGKK